MSAQKVNIIGGGMAGLSLAMTLQQLGIPYKLYEKKHEIAYDDVGLGISANIYPILKTWGIFDDTESIGGYIKDFHFVDKNMKPLKSFRMKNPALSVRRKPFYEILQGKIDHANLMLCHQKSQKDFSLSEVLVSAEGIHASTRTEWYPTIPLRDSGQLLWRGISRMNLPQQYKNAYHDLIGDNLRFAIIHTGGDYYSWYLIKEENENLRDLRSKQDLLELCLAGYPEITKAVVANTNEVFFSRLIDIKPQSRKHKAWHKENHILIGDAIHPTTPNMANGACLSIEDGFVLAQLLSAYDSPQHAFYLFQKDREPKINKVVTQSWLLGKAMHWNNPMMTYLTKRMIQLTPQFLFTSIYSTVLEESKLLAKKMP